MTRPIAKPTPIVLDREAIVDYAKLLADDVIARAEEVSSEQELDQIDEHAELLTSSYGVSDPVTKRWIEVPIVVRTEFSSLTPNSGDLIVTSMVHEDGDRPTVEIVVNGAYQWSKLRDLRDRFIQGLFKILMRELPIAAEMREEKKSPFMQNIADEAVARAKSLTHEQRSPTREMVLAHVRDGKFFKSMANMKLRERAKALKAVYSSLVDAGLV